MSGSKVRVPAVEGWFTTDDEPRLIGSKCAVCGTYFFPRRTGYCNNPECGSSDIADTLLSNRGRVWSYTENHYAPPPPFIPAQPFTPYAIAAVELEAEKLVVLGQVVGTWHAADLQVGQELTLVLDTLYEDDDNVYLIWKWSP
jgi:uncharacterized protein